MMEQRTHPARDAKTCAHEPLPRRVFIERLAALGLAGPTTLAALRMGDADAAHAFLVEGELLEAITTLAKKANSTHLASITPFEISGRDLPWKHIGGAVRSGQQVTFLLSGRWWIVRDLDVWVEPGLAFFARVDGKNPIYNPMKNTGTMTAPHAGGLAVARAIGEWADKHAETVSTPAEIYQQAEGRIEGVALAWNGDALDGLRELVAVGDVGGLINAEIDRLTTEPSSPAGWYPMYLTGNPGIFSTCTDKQICCHTHKNACLLKTDVDIPLVAGATIDWRWVVEELPSAKSEDSLLNHDYLSLAVEFDDGQDLTYMWSADLPAGHVFRCPIPGWHAIETHMVVRTGRDQLGSWLDESRDLYADYAAHIGGDAKRIVGVWLIALSFFQRGTGKARYADIVVSSGDQRAQLV